MVDWSKIPDLGSSGAPGLCFCLCVAAQPDPGLPHVAYRLGHDRPPLRLLHVSRRAGNLGSVAIFLGLAALIWAGTLFMWASVPYRNQQASSQWILIALLLSNTLYVGLLCFVPSPSWALTVAAVLYGALPLGVTLAAMRKFNHWLRWATCRVYSLLSIFLLVFQNRPGNGADLALNAVLFTVYFGCCIHFWYMYRRATAGAFITIAGFLAWASVFVIGPCMAAYLPSFHLESEVWNLPKYVVAVGMILLLLENQIEHNKFLALHDELTGLPNRRLFQDRLSNALERARRNGAMAALLLLDLDNFKQVNDLLGHHAGDLLLQQVSAIFSGRVRRSDTVARTGGDEFCVILEDPTSRADAERVGRSLIQLLSEPIQLSGATVKIGASVGIAFFPEDADEMEALCIKADLRMYAEKNAARAQGVPPKLEVSGRFILQNQDAVALSSSPLTSPGHRCRWHGGATAPFLLSL